MKKYVIFAGVNGAGKSTLYNTSQFRNTLPRVNSDEILKTFGDWRNESDVMKAGKMAVKMIDEYFKNEKSFNQETTLCGHSILKNIKRAKEQGYLVEMFLEELPYIRTENCACFHEMFLNGFRDYNVDVDVSV